MSQLNVPLTPEVWKWWKVLKSRNLGGQPHHICTIHGTQMLQVLTLIINAISLLVILGHQQLYIMWTLYKLYLN